MKIAYYTHSLASCWNHGNAHFLRGVLRELQAAGHAVTVLEPQGAWSLENLLAEQGEAGLAPYRRAYPELTSRQYDPAFDHAAVVAAADLVLVHEWNRPELVSELGRLRKRGGGFRLLFHDTHHRAVSDPEAMRAYDLDGFDGILAFGESLAQVYRRWGWGDRVFVWHEAADTRLFRPPPAQAGGKGGGGRQGLVWIGNWGDGERSAELSTFLLDPVRRVGLPLDVWGVRYPPDALARLAAAGARYRGWIANAAVPEVFARHLATVHVPRRFYAEVLPGIPTIRMFEALACGIPLVSAPWRDSEGLFRTGSDYLVAEDGDAMERQLRRLAADADLRSSLAACGLATILAGHSCAHRMRELLAIAERIGVPRPAAPASTDHRVKEKQA
jgi:spore maturation protein CgeB